MEQRFAPALEKLRKLFEDATIFLQVPIRFALIGGLAVSAWGVVRATQDIDLLADRDPRPLRNPTLQRRLGTFLEQRGCVAERRAGESDDPIPLLLRLGLPRPMVLSADVLWAHKRWHREALNRRVTLQVSNLDIFVLHPEDLVLLKLDAGGPQDLLDVEGLLSNPPSELNLRRLKRRAVQLRLTAALERCLSG
jgi:hypothetical protein